MHIVSLHIRTRSNSIPERGHSNSIGRSSGLRDSRIKFGTQLPEEYRNNYRMGTLSNGITPKSNVSGGPLY